VRGLHQAGHDLKGEAVARLLNDAGFLTRRGNPWKRQSAEVIIQIAKRKK